MSDTPLYNAAAAAFNAGLSLPFWVVLLIALGVIVGLVFWISGWHDDPDGEYK